MPSSIRRPTYRSFIPAPPTAIPVGKTTAPYSQSAFSRTGQPGNSRLDNPNWKPYRNSQELALKVYEMTHPQQPSVDDNGVGLS
ncbi:hypothetical protein S7335_950 [Synechococcus sp. PCC 7335]|uniref:hypothetical protein n=1 Tax=Synechococcus sp. (strain ATCC 29403 / PCC 7335) TaxID=91464 RepID=UPI00017ECF36|nr:hypothetical protein [Synechococcus sp. PCC 7335]EDX82649.1 hypothetical protein S7335_950 [Synechococcus sp. PCC 7335]